ncbi:MAG: hypothetical protein NBV67_16920 [Tagaea sp.]|nr:hypothetical protein [Tagaea sp.]
MTLKIRHIEPDLADQLRARALAEGISVAEHVRRTLLATHPDGAPDER